MIEKAPNNYSAIARQEEIQKFIFFLALLFISLMMTSCESSELSLKDIDFTDGDYALIYTDEEQNSFLVEDEQVLIKNKDYIKISGSRINPGFHSSESRSLRLFRNNKLVISASPDLVSTFSVDSLKEHGKKVYFRFLLSPKDQFIKQRDSLRTKKNIFITDLPSESFSILDQVGKNNGFASVSDNPGIGITPNLDFINEFEVNE